MEQRRYRMYGLVPYNISPIQQGIQYGHAVVEYGLFAHEMSGGRANDVVLDKYLDWANNDKVFIILNGGTTNSRIDPVTLRPKGTLNEHLVTLSGNGVILSTFYEEDLGDQLTAITFLVDDRVWDKEAIPDWEDAQNLMNPATIQPVYWNKEEWDTAVGGKQNVFLREFLSQFRLA